MKYEKIHLKNYYQLDTNPILEALVSENYDLEDLVKPALIIIPGGGYGFLAKREADPIAITFLARNYNCFILHYTIRQETNEKYLYPIPQLETMAAFDFLVKNSKEYFINPKQIFMIGFSAGGHLVGSYSYLYNDVELLNKLKINDSKHLKPTGICLSYPVISFTPITHEGTFDCLINKDSKYINKLSIEKNVSHDYPPTYVWTTKDDECVNSKNSEVLYEALNKNHVQSKLTIFKHGNHGLSVVSPLVQVYEENDAITWIDECDQFFKNLI